MIRGMTLRAACEDDSSTLTELAFRSKAHWGYSPEFMEACRDELAVSREDIANPEYAHTVAESRGRLLGYYALMPIQERGYELDALFVEPEFIGRGVGRALVEHAKSRAAELGARYLLIQGDPNASEFYLAAGAVQVGERESGSIPGRFLPEFRISLPASDGGR